MTDACPFWRLSKLEAAGRIRRPMAGRGRQRRRFQPIEGSKTMRPDKGKDTFERKTFRTSRLAEFASIPN